MIGMQMGIRGGVAEWCVVTALCWGRWHEGAGYAAGEGADDSCFVRAIAGAASLGEREAGRGG